MADSSGASHSSRRLAAPAPPLPLPPRRSQSKGSRRVLFAEDLPHKDRSKIAVHEDRNKNDNDNDNENDDKCRPFCFACFAWTCLAVFAVILFLLIIGILFASFLHAGLPHIGIRSLKFTNLQVQNPNSARRTKSIRADLEFIVEFSNENEKTELALGPLSVEVLWKNFRLAETKIRAFSERPRNTTELRVNTAIKQAGFDEEQDADELISSLKNSEAVLRVIFRGKVGFHIGEIDLKGIPLLIACNLQQAEVDRGNKSLCTVRIFNL